MTISVIIPTLNEEVTIGRLLRSLVARDFIEIIVVDAGSVDQTVKIVARFAKVVLLTCKRTSRAEQMNMGAEAASGDILLFMHADIQFPDGFEQNVEASILGGNNAGCFCYWFDSPRRLLRINAYFTKFKGLISRGGDQTLFIKRSFFRQLGGFNPGFCVMEDFELIQRIRMKGTFVVRPERILVSARKYNENAWLRVQGANLVAFIMFRLHVEPAKIERRYKGLLSVN